MLLTLISNCLACLVSLLPPNECKYDVLRFDLLRTRSAPTSHPLSCVPQCIALAGSGKFKELEMMRV